MSEAEKKIENFRKLYDSLTAEIGKVVVGRKSSIEQILLCLFGGGHALVEGLPGLGKTKLVSTLASCLELDFRRIQFTPDLMPSDITGTDVLTRGTGETRVEFSPGPVFTNVLLADEINRAAPRTQSALLEVMQERSCTVMGKTRPLPSPFFVFATQNPIELEGTYPLPEAQLDRFMFKIDISHEGVEQMTQILDRFTGSAEPKASKVASASDVIEAQNLVREVVLPKPVADAVSELVCSGSPLFASSPEIVRRYVKYPPSPRAALSIVMAAKARALSLSRPQVDFADIKAVAHPALRHRLLLNFEGETARVQTNDIISEMLNAMR